ncbi:DUF1761 domain-containing protein [uncultured Tateyamaria sp.]|uniref:DUF1761 domain-containing protein n=1 Tax=uncultured Tateyamaria sp. TaxID=455651 RepID=UPI00262B81A4|nr:DUF1761 domain-containing protein [uncultured Tateyamaria sp.]
MGFLAVLVAGIAGFMFGAIWYTVLAKPWMAASGVALNEAGDAPANQKDPLPYITSVVGAILVAGMMRHAFVLSGINSFGEGLVSGFGIGLFLVTPWIATFYAFGARPFRLTLIDGGYATFGCTVIAAVLSLF